MNLHDCDREKNLKRAGYRYFFKDREDVLTRKKTGMFRTHLSISLGKHHELLVQNFRWGLSGDTVEP